MVQISGILGFWVIPQKMLADDEEQAFEPIPIASDVIGQAQSKEFDMYSWAVQHWPWLIPLVVILKVLGALLFVYLFVGAISTSSPQSGEDSSFSLPLVGLRERIHVTSKTALAEGSLHTRPIKTSMTTHDGLKVS